MRDGDAQRKKNYAKNYCKSHSAWPNSKKNNNDYDVIGSENAMQLMLFQFFRF